MTLIRNVNDKLHLNGSFYLTQFFALIYLLFGFGSIECDSCTCTLLLSWFLAALGTNLLGITYELLEWKFLPLNTSSIFDRPIFKKHPILLHVSGDGIFDKHDIMLNVLGSLLIVPIFLYFKEFVTLVINQNKKD